jgi:acetyl-CoA synthetase
VSTQHAHRQGVPYAPPAWDWDVAAREAGATPEGIFNAGAVTLNRDAAVRWTRADGTTVAYTGEQMARRAGQISAVLQAIGVGRGDRVAGLISRRPLVFATALAVWRLGAIYVPLFSGFAGEGLRSRLEDCAPVVAVTDGANRAALAAVQDCLPALQVLVGGGGDAEPGDASLETMIERHPDLPEVAATGLHEISTIMYTSGTTGKPKGCLIPHRAVVSLRPYIDHCLAVRPGEVLFSGADAGWSFGLFTSGLAPMSRGVSRVIYEGGFDPEGWYDSIRVTQATHLMAAPTAFRQMVAKGPIPSDLPLTQATSAGEPLDAPTLDAFREATGVTVHDSYGLSELGMVAANVRTAGAPPVIPGSMGVSLPGFEIRLVDEAGNEVVGEGEGRLAVRDNGFFLSSGYWQRQPEWDARFQDDWFVTEDLASRDAMGRYTHRGRADDVIVTAGYNVSPGEVESVLLDHPLVTDVACVAEPDPLKGSAVAAHIVIRGAEPADLLTELRQWVGERVGWHAAPRRIHVREQLPRTESGKVQRAVLRSQGGQP